MSPDVAASVRARLLNRAKDRGEEFELSLVRFAAERFLYRLGKSAARDRCLVKGAAMLSVWLPDPYRMTRDVDLLAFGAADDAAIRELINEICAVPCPEDGLVVDLSDLVIETIRPEEEYSGKRARFRAFLGKARIPVQVDIGMGDAVAVTPEEVTYPVLLPSLPAPSLRAYSRELTVAEKFEAMVKLDTRNSRMKDFHDLWSLAGAFEFDGILLQRAVSACFERRGAPWSVETPRPLTPAFYRMRDLHTRWRNYLAAGTVLIPPPAQFETIGERITAFLGPLRDSIIVAQQFKRAWMPQGPWTARTKEESE